MSDLLYRTTLSRALTERDVAQKDLAAAHEELKAVREVLRRVEYERDLLRMDLHRAQRERDAANRALVAFLGKGTR